jgi:hypothetical protein
MVYCKRRYGTTAKLDLVWYLLVKIIGVRKENFFSSITKYINE